MNERENFFKIYNGEKPEWIPCFYDAYQPMGSSLINNTGKMFEGGEDMFGVTWICTADTGYQPIPDPRKHLFDDITHWDEYVKFPDIDKWDWENAAKKDLDGIDKGKLLCYFGMEGNFNRLQSMMGVIETMIAMLEETEAVESFFDAYTEFKIKTIKKIAKYYKPDIYVNGDDVCSSTGLFFSPELHKRLIAPFEKRLAQAAIEEGIIVEHHVCGDCKDIIESVVDSGARIWQTAQPMNDLIGIKEKYKGKLILHGGWDSTGAHNFDNATEEEVRSEVRRCIDTYGRDGNFMLFPIIVGDPDKGIMQKKRAWASDECRTYSEKILWQNN